MPKTYYKGRAGMSLLPFTVSTCCFTHMQEKNNGLNKAQMRAAMDTVEKGMSMKRAAIECKVPSSTLNNRHNHRKCSTTYIL